MCLATLLFVHYNIDYKYVPEYSILHYVGDVKPYAKYSKGFVYIINDLTVIDSMNVNNDDVIILDQRNDDNPTLKVLSSYKIKDNKDRRDIISIMQDYNKEFPSKWDRTIESLSLEWYVHNTLYDINYKHDHTTDVDFDNSDEDYYNKPFINKLIKI